MSIYGTWRAKTAMADTLASYLPGVVTGINTEDPADGLVLYVPVAADILTYAVAGPGQNWPFKASVLVIEILCGDSEVTGWQPAEVSAGRLTQEHEIDLRLSLVDREDRKMTNLAAAVELYIAACDRVLVIEHNRLGTAGEIESCVPLKVEFRNIDADKVARQATRRYRVRTFEVNT